MTGPQHYREAELLAREAVTPDHIALAQVHATLALAAAIVDGPAVMRPEDRDDWDHATGRMP